MRRYALRDDQWDRIKEQLPGREGHIGVTAKDNRLFVEAVLYSLPMPSGPSLARPSGSLWRSDKSSDAWKNVFEILAADADNTSALIDSTITPTSPGPG